MLNSKGVFVDKWIWLYLINCFMVENDGIRCCVLLCGLLGFVYVV